MTSSFRKASVVVAICQERLRAVEDYLDPAVTMAVAGQLLTKKQVAARYQRCLDARSRVVAAQAALKGALAERDAAEKERQLTDPALRAWVTGLFGMGSAEFRAFGFVPDKKGHRSAEVQARAAERALATRAARKTMGSKQRLKIKGEPRG